MFRNSEFIQTDKEWLYQINLRSKIRRILKIKCPVKLTEHFYSLSMCTQIGWIFAIFKSKSLVLFCIDKLQRNSVLSFTYEKMQFSKIIFVVVSMNKFEDVKVKMWVHVNSTGTCICAKFSSHTPENYRRSILKSLVSKEWKHRSTWKYCHAYIGGLRQDLANSRHPQFLVD